jgi:hypothetical protein
MLPRPRFRMPLWVAFGIVALAYVVRSALRGFDFRPDLPLDAIAAVAFLVVAGIVAYIRSVIGSEDDSAEAQGPSARKLDDPGPPIRPR